MILTSGGVDCWDNVKVSFFKKSLKLITHGLLPLRTLSSFFIGYGSIIAEELAKNALGLGFNRCRTRSVRWKG